MDEATRAFEAMGGWIRSGLWPVGSRMPPLAVLAKQCAVSRTTMWHALTLLKKEDLVHTKRNGMILCGPLGALPPVSTPGILAWEHLKSRVGKEILLGTFGEGRIPPVGKLALRYGAAANTLRKALASLVADGLLAREGAGYTAAYPRRRHHQPSVVLVGEGASREGINAKHVLTQRILESFERESMRLGYASLSVGFDSRDANCQVDFASETAGIADVVGYLVTLWEPWDTTRRRRWVDLLQFLAKSSVPIIIIDHIGSLALPEALLRNAHLRVIRIAGIRAGEIMADFLIRRGYDRIAYITAQWNSAWAQKRYQGLCRHVEHFGPTGSRVELFSIDDSLTQNNLALALLDPTDREIRTLFRAGYSRDEVEDMVQTIGQLRTGTVSRTLSQGRAAETIRTIAEKLAVLDRGKPDRVSYNFFLDQIVQYAGTRGQQVYHAALFRRVLSEFSGTLWACSEDRTAMNALHFLRQNRKLVPAEISVTGFDNWPEAYEHHITTFDFDMHGIIMQALLLIVDRKRLKDAPAVSEFDGYVVERRTTRR